MPWQHIQTASHEIDRVYREKGGPDGKAQLPRAACAVGAIQYKDGLEGVLVYVKA